MVRGRAPPSLACGGRLATRHDESTAARFLRECEALSPIRHPGVVRHVARGMLADGRPRDLANRSFFKDGDQVDQKAARAVIRKARVAA